jgi:parallel beta-helix repeat protein
LTLILPVDPGLAGISSNTRGGLIISAYIYLSNQTLIIDGGDLKIINGGTLDVSNSTIIFDCKNFSGVFGMDVQFGGELKIDNNSKITSATPGIYYYFQISGKALINNSIIEWVRIDDSNPPKIKGGIEIYSLNVNISNCNIRNCELFDIYIDPSSTGNSNIVIDSCNLHGPNALIKNMAIRIEGGAIPSITHNTISNVSGAGISVRDNSRPQITDNIIINCTYGIQVGDTARPRIINNTITNYYPDDNTKIDGILNAMDSDAWIEGNIIENSQYGIENQQNSTPTITRNTILNSSFSGIMNTGNSMTVKRIIMSDNNIIGYNNISASRMNRTRGIDNENSTNPTIFHNNISGFSIGICNFNYSCANITQNHIMSNFFIGILNKDQSIPNITLNHIYNNNCSGIQCEGSSNSPISGNSIYRNPIGINCTGHSTPTIINNTINNSLGDGILGGEYSSMIIAKNKIFNNINGIRCVDSCQIDISGDLLDNNNYGINMSLNSNGTINGVTISNSICGIKLFQSSPRISNSIIINSRNGIHYSISKAPTYNVTIKADDNFQPESAISCEAASSPFISGSKISIKQICSNFYVSTNSHPVLLTCVFDNTRVLINDRVSSLRESEYGRVKVTDSNNEPVSYINITLKSKSDKVSLIKSLTTGADGITLRTPVESRIYLMGEKNASVILYDIAVGEGYEQDTFPNKTITRDCIIPIQFDFPPVIANIADKTLSEDTEFRLDVSEFISDKDHDLSRLDISLCEDELNVNVDNNNKTLIFKYSSPVDSDTIFFNLSDGIRSTTGSITIHVSPVNDPPIYNGPTHLILNESETRTLELRSLVSDEDNRFAELVFNFSHVDPRYIYLNGLDLIINYTDEITQDWINITIDDGNGSMINVTITIEIKLVNDPPEMKKIARIDLVEETEKTIDLTNNISDPDTSLENITITTSSKYIVVEGLRLICNYSENITSENVTIYIFDGYNTTSYDIVVHIKPINDPPYLTSIPLHSCFAGESISIDIGSYVHDNETPGGLSISTVYPHVKVNAFNLTISFPADTPSGLKHIRISLTDGTDSTPYDILVNVKQGPKPKYYPIFDNIFFILVPFAIIGGAVAILAYRRIKYGWYDVKRAFLVYTDGRMLAHYSKTVQSNDEMLVSSMLTAVQQFIEEVMKKDKAGALKEFQYEDMKIAIEKGDKIYLAVFLNGYATETLRKEMRQILRQIESKHKQKIADWDGRMTDNEFIDEAERKLKSLTKKKK